MNYNKAILLFMLLSAFQYNGNGQNIARQLMNDFPKWIDEKGENPHPESKILGPGLFTHISPLREEYSNVKNEICRNRKC